MSTKLLDLRFPETDDPSAYIEQAKAHLDEAALHAIPRQYAQAHARIAQADTFPSQLSRSDYEAACRTLGVVSLADAQCNPWGVIDFPSYDADTVLSHRLALRRCYGIQAERATSTPSTDGGRYIVTNVPKPSGLLWERCGQCGRQPIYMPLHVCLNCWPK